MQTRVLPINAFINLAISKEPSLDCHSLVQPPAWQGIYHSASSTFVRIAMPTSEWQEVFITALRGGNSCMSSD